MINEYLSKSKSN